MKDLTQLSSAIAKAQKSHYEKVIVPQLYLFGLQNAQIFEFQLLFLLSGFVQKAKNALEKIGINYNPKYKTKWTYKELIDRIETYLPKRENIEFYRVIKEAEEARNKFIHESFKLENGLVNLEIERFYLNKDAKAILDNWLKLYCKANELLLKMNRKYFNDIKVKPLSFK